jgi:tetratricopeptide (TPR) repeat protein
MARYWIHLPLLALLASPVAGEVPEDPTSPLRQALSDADQALQSAEPELAESRYRTAVLEGWLLMGSLAQSAGDLPTARAAFERASTVALETRRPLVALGAVLMRLGEGAEAVKVLQRVLARHQHDQRARRLLAEALVAVGRPEQAIQELEEIRAAVPDDPEIAFALASAHGQMGRIEEAEALFADVLAARPGASTLVLLGRTYRDLGLPQRAAAALTQALELDPRVRRAHYYAGTLALREGVGSRLEDAIAEFQQELALHPDDEDARLSLGLSLVEARRYDEALPHLQLLAAKEPPPPDALLYLGRCLLGLGKPREATEPLRRALAIGPGAGLEDFQLHSLEYQLALALQRQGLQAEAAEHFAAAERLSAQKATDARDQLARYLAAESDAQGQALALTVASSGQLLAGVDPERLAALRRYVPTALARAYFNLGVMRLQASAFKPAVELLEPAAELAPELPGVQRALAVAHVNAQQYQAAVAPLERALAREPQDAELRRLLAVCRLETGNAAGAAELLAGDPQRASDPALQYTYALALVRSGQSDAAEEVFAQLLREHAEWPQLHVLLGQARAAENDFPGAVAAMQRALELSPAVPEASSTLGAIYLRQGKLDEAEAAFRAELAHHPDDVQARYQLATVLELAGKQEEAVEALLTVLARTPAFADGRYLLGKMLLARGDAGAAAVELEAAAELAPSDANVHYQLAQAYQKLGRVEAAAQQLERYRELKRQPEGGGSP